jgi:hypothetical protein
MPEFKEGLPITTGWGATMRITLFILSISLLWVLLEQIAIGKSLPNAISYTLGFLAVYFGISLVIAVPLGILRKSKSVALIAFSICYSLLFLAVKLLPLLVLTSMG